MFCVGGKSGGLSGILNMEIHNQSLKELLKGATAFSLEIITARYLWDIYGNKSSYIEE